MKHALSTPSLPYLEGSPGEAGERGEAGRNIRGGAPTTASRSPSPIRGRRKATFCALSALTLLFAPVLSGCGFTPLYASPAVSGGLPAITVVAPQGRVGYLLREDLDDALAHDKSIPPAWRLEVSVVEKRDPRGLSVSDVAERYDLGLTVNYTLTSIATGKVSHAGQVSTDVSYDAADAPYAGISARQDSQERVASDAARRIQIQLAAWMARHAAE